MHSLSDGSGYYATGADSSSRSNIWKYKQYADQQLDVNV